MIETNKNYNAELNVYTPLGKQLTLLYISPPCHVNFVLTSGTVLKIFSNQLFYISIFPFTFFSFKKGNINLRKRY